MSGVNRQGQAHIMSTAIVSPRSRKMGGAFFRTWFSIDPQPASISPTINISIVFICTFLVDCRRIICHSAIKNDSWSDPIFILIVCCARSQPVAYLRAVTKQIRQVVEEFVVGGS